MTTIPNTALDLSAEVSHCIRCGNPFDPIDTRWNGKGRHASNPWCRACLDACHDSDDAFHWCPIDEHRTKLQAQR